MLDAAAVRALLAGTRFADIHVIERTGSTNEEVLPLLSRADPIPHTIVAEYQTHGMGRRGRSWLAAPGTSLLWTTTLPPLPVSHLWAIPFWVALRIAEGVADATDMHTTLQWPNDVYLDNRKLAGVLCVSRIAADLATVGCGIGLNVVRPNERLDLEYPAAFIGDYASITREQLLACILYRFDKALDELAAPEVIARAWERRARLAGTPYRILLDGESQPFTAVAKHLSDNGGLVVDRDGTAFTVHQADARVIR